MLTFSILRSETKPVIIEMKVSEGKERRKGSESPIRLASKQLNLKLKMNLAKH
jgi:hypothetical protein